MKLGFVLLGVALGSLLLLGMIIVISESHAQHEACIPICHPYAVGAWYKDRCECDTRREVRKPQSIDDLRAASPRPVVE